MSRSTKESPLKDKKTDAIKKETESKTALKKSVSKRTVSKEPAVAEEPKIIQKPSAAKKKAAAKKEPIEEAEELIEEAEEQEAPVKKTRAVKTKKAVQVESPLETPAEPEKPLKRKATKKQQESAVNEADAAEIIPEEKPQTKKPRKNAKKDAEEIEEADEDSLDIEEKVFNLIKNTPGGIYQNEVWKKTSIDSRKCSRILKKLMDAELILREEAVVSGTKTYLLKTAAEEKKRNYDVLMVKNVFSPCTGCFGECRPEYCPALTFWIMNISENPEELRAAMGYNPSEPESHEIEMPPEFIEDMKMGDDADFGEEIVYE
jgi:Uncharacterized membrane-associated protein/domain